MRQTQRVSERSATLTKAVIRASDFLGLGRQELSATIGLSASTLSRMFKGEYFLDEGSKNWELAALLVRLYRGLDAIMAGDENSLKSWMHNPNTDLHDTPLNLIGSVTGLTNTLAYVDANRARI